MSYKGKFKPTNPSKYNGDHSNIVYRSLWERKFMTFCDTSSNVLRWASEEIPIPYISPVDKKYHRYFVDFVIEVKEKDGSVQTYMVEIKPQRKCKEPLKKKKITKGYLQEIVEWEINKSKWAFAEQYANKRNWKFKIITEKELFGKKQEQSESTE